MLLSFLLLAQFFMPVQEQVSSPPVEVLDIEVLVCEFKPHQVIDRNNPMPPGVVSEDEVRGRPKGWEVKDEQPTIETRSRELREVGRRTAREPSFRQTTPLYIYEYRVRVKNTSPKKIKSIVWEYQPSDAADTTDASQRIFLCAVSVKSGEIKVLKASTSLAASRVVSADASDEKPKAVVNRVEYTDGSAWTRDGWKQDDTDATTKIRDGQCRIW